jgi:gluconolactonase
VADTGFTHNKNGPKHIRRIEMNADGKCLEKSIVFADCTAGLFDGFRVDSDGQI